MSDWNDWMKTENKTKECKTEERGCICEEELMLKIQLNHATLSELKQLQSVCSLKNLKPIELINEKVKEREENVGILSGLVIFELLTVCIGYLIWYTYFIVNSHSINSSYFDIKYGLIVISVITAFTIKLLFYELYR